MPCADPSQEMEISYPFIPIFFHFSWPYRIRGHHIHSCLIRAINDRKNFGIARVVSWSATILGGGEGDVAPIFPLTRIGVSVILGHATRTKIG